MLSCSSSLVQQESTHWLSPLATFDMNILVYVLSSVNDWGLCDWWGFPTLFWINNPKVLF